MDNSEWFQKWLLSNGFLLSYNNPTITEYVKPFENGDSLYIILVINEEGKYKLSIHSDAPGWAESTNLELPRTSQEAQLLLWFHGLDL
ncbi:hypothetical protein GCM10028808_74730 [Spirosoma migulaei]